MAVAGTSTLAQFIRVNLDPILDAWVSFAQHIPSARHHNGRTLRDHAKGILMAIAADLERAQTREQQAAKAQGLAPLAEVETEAGMHGAARLSEGFSVNDAMSEFRALRASVLRLWADHQQGQPSLRADEITRFNEAIDQALGESLSRYSSERERNARLFDALLSSSPDLNFICNQDGALLYVNKAFASRYCLQPSEVIGQNLFVLCLPVAADLRLHVRDVLRSKAAYRGEMTYPLPAGTRLVYEYLLMAVLDWQGRVDAIAGTARDITERKASEERVRRSANYDSLTELANRSLFRERLEQDVKHASRTGLKLALLFIDLDGFKEVNDRFGHSAGDQLLHESASRISACVRATDTVARLGGDEFTVILTDVRQDSDVELLAQEILAALSKPFALAQHQVEISGSIGIALGPPEAATPDELVRNADLAMYGAKNSGRNRYRFYSPQLRNAP
jgi:diguanylate cyclase (GGDEF)-like protein/PAS domain S-box-containing protein